MDLPLPHLGEAAVPAPTDHAGTGVAMAMRQRSVCVCADDFGLHAGINAAVLDLAQRRRLGATACMVDGPCWAEGAAALRALPAQWVDVGLHLDLTEMRLSHPLPHRKYHRQRLIAASYLQRLDPHWLAAEVVRQIDAFEARMQRAPAFVSGHRHVHQLPQVREALLHALAQRYPAGIGPRPWLRSTRPALQGSSALATGLRNAFRARAIARLGAQPLAQAAARHGFATNRALAGIYGFDASATRYQQLFAIWLQHCQHGDVLACHPSNSVVPGDAIAPARCIEYQVLAAESFGLLLAQADVHIGPLSRCLQARAHTPPMPAA